MKHLSFIALFVYLGSLYSATSFSAAHDWVDVPKHTQLHSSSLLTSHAQPVKSADLSSDIDKIAVQSPSLDCAPLVDSESQVVLPPPRASILWRCAARAPPLHLSEFNT